MSDVDWMKPVYDVKTGVELFALRGPDGRPFFDRVGGVVAVNLKSGGTTWVDSNASGFTNTPPVRDWYSTLVSRDNPEVVRVTFGRRGGKLFAEVAE